MIKCSKTNDDLEEALEGFERCFLKAQKKGDVTQQIAFLANIKLLENILTDEEVLFRFDDGDYSKF